MKHITKIIFIGIIALITMLSGCTEIKEIKVSDDVKKEALEKVDDNKLRNEPILKKKLSGLENQRILFWIDDENLLTVNTDASELKDKNVILYNYNLESSESTEILNDSKITRILDNSHSGRDGLILIGNKKQAFVYDPKKREIEEVLDFDKEFKDGVPGSKKPKEEQDIRSYNVQFIKQNYISYVSKLNRKNDKDLADTADYTILNYKDNKKYTIEERYSAAGIDCKFDLTGKNIYIGQFSKLTKLNLETEEKVSMKLSMSKIGDVFEDGTLFVYCIEENGTIYDKERLYKVDFDKKEVTRYEKNYEGKNLEIDSIDFKNQFVGYTFLGEGKDREQNVAMYGKLEENKFVVKDKLFKNNEDAGCNTSRHFIFSPNHNKFITGVVRQKWENDSPNSPHSVTDDEYLFELQ